ncbi:hypothetical protein X975_00135, partial [Stegodyphus mimosarum]
MLCQNRHVRSNTKRSSAPNLHEKSPNQPVHGRSRVHVRRRQHRTHVFLRTGQLQWCAGAHSRVHGTSAMCLFECGVFSGTAALENTLKASSGKRGMLLAKFVYDSVQNFLFKNCECNYFFNSCISGILSS